MSWLKTHEVSIPFYENREGKLVFAIQLQRRGFRQEEFTHNLSGITSTSSQHICQQNDHENKYMTDSTAGVQITAMRSYSQFRNLWKTLTLATKMHSAASLSRSNSTEPARVGRPSICRCRDWNCVFRSFHYFLKSYSFPSRFLMMCSKTSALESRRQGLELFVTTLRKLFDKFSRTFLQNIDMLENCQVLMALNDFFGISEKSQANLALRTKLQLPPIQKEAEKTRRIRSDAVSESATSFACSPSSRSGVSSCIGWNADDEYSCIKTESSSVQAETMHAGVEDCLRDKKVDSTKPKDVDYEFNRQKFQQLPMLPNDKYGKSDISSMIRTSIKYLTSPHRESSFMGSGPGSRWIQRSRGVDGRLRTAFLAPNPTVETRIRSATYDMKASQTLLPSLPQLSSTSEETSIRSFRNQFKDHLLMDPQALGSSAKPMENWNEDRQWELALYVASQIGHAYAVECILCRGPDPNAVMEDGLSSLQVACRGGHRSIVAMLLTSGADTNITDSNGVSPLLSAVQLGDLEIVEMLIEYGADVNLCNADSVYAVHVAVACQTLPVLRLLLEHNAFVNTKNSFNAKTPLHLAAESGSLPMCKLLLNHGANIHHKTARGLNVVDLAKSYGHENIARYCLNFDKNVIHCESNTTRKRTTSASTSECSHEVRIVSEDGYAYAVL